MIFTVENGSFEYTKEKQLFSDINLSVEQGDILSILGSNGIGKTTLLKCALGFLKWKKGRTLIDGQDVRSMPGKKFWQKVGYVPQARLSSFVYTVEEMVLLGRNSHLRPFEQPNDEDKRAAEKALQMVGMNKLKDKLCSRISGGELQMVLMARALATEPKLLVLDEPESGLDFRNQLVVLDTIRSLSKDKGISAIVNTHYPEHALAISNKALILEHGGTHVFGNAMDVINETELKKAFDVDVRIRSFDFEKVRYTAVMPISICE